MKLIYPTFNKYEVDYTEYLKKYYSAVKTAYINPKLALLRCSYGLFTKRSFTESYFYSKKIKDLLFKEKFDIALVGCSSMAQYILDITLPKVVGFVDIDSDKWKLYSQQYPFPASVIYRLEYARLQRREHEISNKSNYCLVVSENEKALLNRENVIVVPNGVDSQFFRPRNKQIPNTLVFSGV